PVAVAPRVVDIADSPVSTSIDQDAPSTSIPSTQEQEHSLIISQGVEELPKTPHFHDDPLHESLHEDSTSQGSSSNVFLALGWLLEEIHVTWAHFGKKQTRLRTYTKSLKDLCKQWLKTASQA
ncbi:hypothetical protein Tco_0670660, partial [Tanacetum coccineum]